MTNENCSAKCPKCGKRSKTPHAGGPRIWYCHGCKMPFEDVEDGEVGYGRPEKVAERHERNEKHQRPGKYVRREHGWE